MTEKIQEAARQFKVYILWPVYEKGEQQGIIYNSAAMFDDRGEMIAIYRKTHPFPAERLQGGGWTTPGDRAVMCDLPWAKAGIIIC